MGAQKIFIFLGFLFLFIGLLFPYIKKINLFHLPGDIVIDKPNIKIYFPIVSMLLISALLSLILWAINKFFK